jgi:hypothetical protein
MTTVVAEIDARHAARLALRLRGIATKGEPALEPDQSGLLKEAADFLEDAAGVERGKQVKQSTVTGEVFVVRKWIDRGDGQVVALTKEPVGHGREAER